MNEERKFRDLRKSATDKKIAGVCGGFGEYTPFPSWMWRVAFFLSIFICGFGLLTYIVLWISMPEAHLSIGRDNNNPQE
jgi:phage shock protein PspC (stress-responsive transcriptional regulator)